MDNLDNLSSTLLVCEACRQRGEVKMGTNVVHIEKQVLGLPKKMEFGLCNDCYAKFERMLEDL